ncbi:NAD(P)-dependent oxidoreductase [Clostridium sp. AM58-1XD]|uniref:NAD-dependent epimerase/dehydratase family protein n=1 Tax=Clostridium sp. AM58-1XD TaxID=2292307 RepID=UPI000E4FEC39|nr:NAD(P)-dependent oxidoreductase [Clostridium sp. AM58-1XD]RGY99924.1 NAD(P)-dependent oxidoreductase [Clostridium sp. AM58-1XD]
MDVIITGGTSFIGLAVIRKLLAENHNIWAVVRPESANRGKLPEDERVHVITCGMDDMDRLSDRTELKALPEKVFLHMAWEGVGSAGRSDPSIQKKNIENSLKAIEAAERLSCRRFIFSGSQAEYGIHRDAMTEKSECRPVSEYGKAKLEFGRKAAKNCREMEYVHCRIFSVYGPGDHPWSLVSTCMRTFLENGHMELGECTQKWNFLYIDDMAEAVAALLFNRGETGGIYNIAGDDTRVLREFVEEMHDVCEKKGSFSYGKRAPNAEGPASLMPDISKIKSVTGWKPRTAFCDGIEKIRRSMI